MILKTTLGLLALAASAFAAPSFTVTDIGIGIYANGLSSNGYVSGAAGSSIFVYNPNTSAVTYTSLPGPVIYAYVNSSGEVAGIYQSSGGSDVGFVDNGGVISALPVTGTGAYLNGIVGIDDAGDVGGNVNNGNNNDTIWLAGGGTLVVGNVNDMAISASGLFAYGTGPTSYVYNINSGTTASITMPQYELIDTVSSNGIIGGSNSGTGYIGSAGSGVTNIGTVNSLTAVNSSSAAVGGFSTGSANHAFLYSSGAMLDLNGLLATSLNSILGGTGWYLTTALAINDAGQVVAYAYNGSQTATVLLTPAGQSPTPEPASLALFGAGATVLYVLRRKQAGVRA